MGFIKSFALVVITEHDFIHVPVVGLCHASHSPAKAKRLVLGRVILIGIRLGAAGIHS
jgi:hypothetical protein